MTMSVETEESEIKLSFFGTFRRKHVILRRMCSAISLH